MRPTPRLLVTALAILSAAGALVAATASGTITRTDGTYTLDTDLSRPTTTQPATGSLLQYPSDPIKLAWRPVPGASKYQVQIARAASGTADCTASSAWQAGNVMLTHTTTELGWVPELVDDDTGKGIWAGTYCWRVRASSAKVAGLWSNGSRFTLTWTAQPANLRFYSDETGDVPRAAGTAGETTGFDTGYLEWDSVAGATQYEVQISNAQTFSTASLFAEKTYPNTRLLLPQMPDNQYTWRVRPVTSTGIKGSWSSIASFRIFHDDRYWGGANNGTSNTLFPADAATINDLRIGWEPVPGASYYRYMASSLSNGFTNLDTQVAYGTTNPNSTTCGYFVGRLTPQGEADSSTINNWATAVELLGPDVMENLGNGCEYDPTPPDINGVDSDPNDDQTRVFPAIPSTIYWRLYPVWKLSSSTEQGWKVADATILGKPIQRHMTLASYGAAEIADPTLGPVSGNQCEQSPGVTVNCLRNLGGSMSPLNSSANSSTMQVPYFAWGTYPNRFDPTKGPGSFRVQIAQDSAFDFKITPPDFANTNPERGWLANKGPAKRTQWAGDDTSLDRFGGFTRSFALTTGLPDEGLVDGDGYFWRALPCTGGYQVQCLDQYNDLTDSQHSPGIAFGVANSGALEFRKHVDVSTAVISGFTPTTPMLKVGPVGASSYAEWQRGIQGADHYEFDVARNQAFDDSDKVYLTTVPRMVPWGATPADVIAPGTWFWRVRAVDRDGLAGSWSDTSSFTATSPAPVVDSSSTTLGVGGTVQWAPVTGAIGYEIAWSTDDGFGTDVTTKDTTQTAYYIPATEAGALYWRVRAKTGDSAFGEWSDGRKITILAPSHIPFGVSASIVNSGSTAIVEGQLVVAGTARNGQQVSLQRKNTSCEGTGSYATLSTGRTGDNIDDGIVRFRVRVGQSYCYRLAWAYATGTLYSAAFELGARPVVSFTPLQRRVRRGAAFCSAIRSNVAITGRMQIQYKVGRVWTTAKTVNVTGMRSKLQCAAINRGGTFPVRVYFDRMVASGGWQNYEPTSVGNGSVKTADSFQIIR